MSELKEAIGLSLANLFIVAKHSEIDTAKDRREALGAACAQSEAAAHKASAELKLSQDQLRNLRAELKAKSAQLEDLRNRSNAALDEQIAQAQGQWNGLQAAIAKSRRELGEVDASLGSLHRRLHLG